MAVAALEALRTIQRALAAPRIESVPKGWLTSQQWADAWGKSRPHTNRLLADAVRAGVMECRTYVVTNGRVTRATEHYGMRVK
jgi:hypothetical protein